MAGRRQPPTNVSTTETIQRTDNTSPMTLVLRLRPDGSSPDHAQQHRLLDSRANQLNQLYNALDLAENSTADNSFDNDMINEPAHRRESHLVWAADTIDNEFMNKKKSKCCCIYEKPREFNESSSSDSSSSIDRFDSGEDESRKKNTKHTASAMCTTSHCRGHKSTCYRKVVLKGKIHYDTHDNGSLPPSDPPTKT